MSYGGIGMTTKRFSETCSTMTVTDNKTGRVYKCEMGIDTGLLELLNSLAEKNEWLKQELFEARKDYIIETSDEVDRALYVADEIKRLYKEIFE